MRQASWPFDEWTNVFASGRLTRALPDLLTQHVRILETNGDSDDPHGGAVRTRIHEAARVTLRPPLWTNDRKGHVNPGVQPKVVGHNNQGEGARGHDQVDDKRITEEPQQGLSAASNPSKFRLLDLRHARHGRPPLSIPQ